jgi:hypothetical protein
MYCTKFLLLILQGCERKFDVKKFVARYPPAKANAAAVAAAVTVAEY